MEYLQITVQTVSAATDLIAMIMYDEGSEGVSIHDNADIIELIEKKLNWDYVDESLVKVSGDKATVCGFFPVDFEISRVYEAIENLKENAVFPMGSLEITSAIINSADWENEWRKYYSPIAIDKVVIVPAWQKWTDDSKIPVYIEPGMAFGTGNHETTSMCIALMQRIETTNKEVLDMGCGSGILGITALLLGAKSALLSDIDPLAVEASKYNAKLNKVEKDCKIVDGDLNSDGKTFDILIANITADILIRLESSLTSTLKKDGYAILSGIIHARASEVETAYGKNFDIVEKITEGEWQAMLLKKRN